MDKTTPTTSAGAAAAFRGAVVRAALQAAAAGYQNDHEATREADQQLQQALDSYVTFAAATARTVGADGQPLAPVAWTFAERDAAGPEGRRAHQLDVLAHAAAIVAALPLAAEFTIDISRHRHEIHMQMNATDSFGITDAEQVAARLGLDQHSSRTDDTGHEYHTWYTGEYDHEAPLSIVLVTRPDPTATTATTATTRSAVSATDRSDQLDQAETDPAETDVAGTQPGTDGTDGERAPRFEARFDSTCPACDEPIEAGDDVSWLAGQVVHDDCAEAAGVHVYHPRDARGGEAW